MNIGFANNTGYEMEVELFPKTAYLHGEVFYKGSAIGGGYKYKVFSVDTSSMPIYSFKYILYTTNDTLLNPNQLLTNIFDSIYIILSDSLNKKIVLLNDSSINMNVNPFTDSSVWTNKWIDSSTPNNDCENKSETKMCNFYFETEYLTGINQSPSI